MSLSSKATLSALKPQSLSNKRVFIRVDYNVPFKGSKISDTKRITSTFQTIQNVLNLGSKHIILASHLGRPEGKVSPQFSFENISTEISEIFETEFKNCAKFHFVNLSNLDESLNFIENCKSSDVANIFLLENLRFHPEEEGKFVVNGEKKKCDSADVEVFQEKLTKFADVYINDAFGAAHRGHSSIVGFKKNCNIPRIAGELLTKELNFFSKALENPARPFIAILGGAKISDKILLIENLLEKCDEIIINGGMAFTLLSVLSKTTIGKSLFDENGASKVEGIMAKAKELGVKIHLPLDFRCGADFKSDQEVVTTSDENVPDGLMGLDIGPKTEALNKDVILRAHTILWNGPPGVFEFEKFKCGSVKMSESVCEATRNGAISIVGGGDTASLVQSLGVSGSISHVSTGGGASLELLEGKILPGVDALMSKDEVQI